MTPCFGIDLGTTASAIGWVRDGVPTLLSIDGSRLVPSVVMWPGGDVLVGTAAQNALPLHPERAVRSSKRLMGTEHVYDLGDRTVTPVDAAEHVLRALAVGAEREVGLRPERVVITVPAWFTQAQRADTRRAGEGAGLVVERILNEPTAAALAHAHGQELERTVMVYDLGGGTFDVSVVRQDGPVVEVLASHGDSLLGGDDIDRALVGRLLDHIGESDPQLRDLIEASPAARVRLTLAAEQAKMELSEVTATTVRVPFLLEHDGRPRHVEVPLDRRELDGLSLPFVERTLRSVDQVLADAGLQPSDLDELLLVGGSTLQPLVWHVLHDRYGLEGSHAIAPREVVALGAAIQAAIIDGSRTDGILVDVAPYPLSVGVATGPFPGVSTHFQCRVLTPRNSPLPSRHAEVFATSHGHQEEARLYVFQGSHLDPRRNVLLGRIDASGLEAAPDGRSRPLRVEFRHDVDGLVQIEVIDELSGRSFRGQVVADGAQQSEMLAELLDDIDELVLGDGTEPDPEPDVATDPVSRSTPLDEARQAFAAVLEAESTLSAEHGAASDELLTLARDGNRALEDGRGEDALTTYDALSDRMFSLGVYL